MAQKKKVLLFLFADFFDDVIDLDFEILVYYGKSVWGAETPIGHFVYASKTRPRTGILCCFGDRVSTFFRLNEPFAVLHLFIAITLFTRRKVL